MEKTSEVFARNQHLFSRFSKQPLAFEEGEASLSSSLKEARDAVFPFLQRQVSSIAIYGIDIAYFEALKNWLKASFRHKLVFIEDDLKILNGFLRTLSAEELLLHPQVSIVWLPDEDIHPGLAPLTNDFYFIASRQKGAEEVYGGILQKVYAMQAYLSKLWFYPYDAHFYSHLTALDECVAPIKTLEFPCLLCGAGPSLEKDLANLGSFKSKAVLIGVGTGMNILNDAGIEADLGVLFDFHASGARRMQSNNAFLIPYFVDLDSSSESAKYVQGPKMLTLTDGSTPWKMDLLKALGIQDQVLYLPPAITSTHYALELVSNLNAPEVMLLGVDLAYLQGRKYAGKKTWLSDADDPAPLMSRKDLLEVGNFLVSRTYNAEAFLYAFIAKNHPDISFFHGSSAGQEIKGMNPLNLKEWDLKENSSLERAFIKQPSVQVPHAAVHAALKARKDVLKPLLEQDFETLSAHPFFEPYKKRLDLKFEMELRFLRMMQKSVEPIRNEMYSFFIKVLNVHLDGLDEALFKIEEKMAFPAAPKVPSPEKGNENRRLFFYENGAIKAKLPYANGKLDGKVELYYDNEQVKSEIEFHEGKRHGEFRFYMRSGFCIEKGAYLHGRPEGEYKQWNRKGFLERKIYVYPDGSFDVSIYDEQGSVLKEEKADSIPRMLDDLKKAFEEL